MKWRIPGNQNVSGPDSNLDDVDSVGRYAIRLKMLFFSRFRSIGFWCSKFMPPPHQTHINTKGTAHSLVYRWCPRRKRRRKKTKLTVLILNLVHAHTPSVEWTQTCTFTAKQALRTTQQIAAQSPWPINQTGQRHSLDTFASE